MSQTKIPTKMLTGLGALALLNTITASLISDASANGKSLITAADYSAMRTLLGLRPGVDVQAYDADLSTYAGITPSANVQSLLGAANYAAMRTLLGLAAIATSGSASDLSAGTVPIARLDVGTGANKLVQFDGSGKYPAADGSAITNILTGGLTQLGSVATTSGATQALTGLSASYKAWLVVGSGISTSGTSSPSLDVTSNSGSNWFTGVTFGSTGGASGTLDFMLFIDPNAAFHVAFGANRSGSTTAAIAGDGHFAGTPLNGLRMAANTGNLDAGSFTVYGFN